MHITLFCYFTYHHLCSCTILEFSVLPFTTVAFDPQRVSYPISIWSLRAQSNWGHGLVWGCFFFSFGSQHQSLPVAKASQSLVHTPTTGRGVLQTQWKPSYPSSGCTKSLSVWVATSSVELDLQVLTVLAQIFVMVVLNGPERGQMAGLHADQKVLSPAALQVHQALQTALGIHLHYLLSMRHITLVEDPAKVEDIDFHNLTQLRTAS